MIEPLPAMAFILMSLLALLVGLGSYRRAHPQHAELPRKLLHISMGVVCLLLPWLFQSSWPVLVLAGVASGLFAAMRASERLRVYLGPALDVRRRSFGDLSFPLGISLLFVLSKGDPLLFCAPTLVLALADPAAALVGAKAGRHVLVSVVGARKTAEGSLAFFLVAALVAQLSLIVFSTTADVPSPLIALSVAVALTIVEAVGWWGLDNLLIPLAGLVVLRAFLGPAA